MSLYNSLLPLRLAVHAQILADLCMLTTVHARNPTEVSMDTVADAEKRADLCKASDIHASKRTGITRLRRVKAPLPQWIQDLQDRHSKATEKELSDIMNCLRQKHQKQMERLDK